MTGPEATPHDARRPGVRRPRARLARASAALAVVGAVLLGGCAQSPGTAAVVEGRVVSESAVQRTTQELAELLPNPLDTSTVLVALVVGPFFIDAAAQNGVGVSDDQARELAARIAESQGVEPDEDALAGMSRGTLDVFRFTLATQQLGQDVIRDVEEQVFAADIDISPRYGDFDETGRLVTPDLPWIGTARP